MMRRDCSLEKLVPEFAEVSKQDAKVYPQRETEQSLDPCLDKEDADHLLPVQESKSKPFELYKRRTTMVVGRKKFLDVVCEALSEYKYVGSNQRADLVLACR